MDFQKKRALPELPSLLDYAGYVLFFPSLFAGPSFDYVDYRQWIETTMFDLPPGTDPKQAPITRKKRRIPRSGTPALWKAINGLLWILAFIKFSVWYNADLVLSDSYMQYGFLRRIWLLEMLGFVTRMKYYGVWYLTEGACILSGMGYRGIDPKTGRVLWNRLQNVHPWGIETAQNSRAYLEYWNINTNHWLRNYMYLRVTPKGRKPGFRAPPLQTNPHRPCTPPLFMSSCSANHLKTSGATFVPSFSLRTALDRRRTNLIMTSLPTSSPKRLSASPPLPSSSLLSRPRSSSGPAFTSTLLSA